MKHSFDAGLELLKSELEKWDPASRPKSNPQIIGYSKSPRATGVAGHFEVGKTKSGKAIHSYPDHPSHSSFTVKDHSDAYQAHKAHASQLTGANPKLAQHHEQAAMHHRQMAAKLSNG